MLIRRSATSFISCACNLVTKRIHFNGFFCSSTNGPLTIRRWPNKSTTPIAKISASPTVMVGTIPTKTVQKEEAMPTYTRREKDAWSKEDIAEIPEYLRPEKSETLDLILRKRIYLLQSRRGYRANTDSQLLAFFASYRHVRGDGVVRALDLGAGNGLVAILFGRSRPATSLTLLELQQPLACRARRNLALNDLHGTVLSRDLALGLPSSLRSCFDAVLMNPPFYAPGTRAPPRRLEKRLAHIESSANINQFCIAASLALRKTTTSRLYVVYDLREMHRLERAISNAGLHIVATQQVRHSINEQPARILVEAAPFINLKRVELKEICLHPPGTNLYEYNEEMERFLIDLPPATLKIGRLRPDTW